MWILNILFTLFIVTKCDINRSVAKEVRTVNLAILIDIHENCRLSGDSGMPAICLHCIENFEAMLWMVQKLNDKNNGTGFIPGVHLGFKAFDTCVSKDITRQAVTSVLPNKFHTGNSSNFIGIIGPVLSYTAAYVADMLKTTDVAQVGFTTTVPSLSNTTLYPNFYRMAASDKLQAQALVEIVRKFNWTFISVVHTDDNYGVEGMQEFTRLSRKCGICITMTRSIPLLSRPSRLVVDIIGSLRNQLQKTSGGTMGVVFFGIISVAKELLYESNSIPLRSLYWIMTDGVGRSSTIQHYPKVNKGIITIAPTKRPIPTFTNHMIRRVNDTIHCAVNSANPWMDEFVMTKFNCKLRSSQLVSREPYNQYSKYCDFLTPAEIRAGLTPLADYTTNAVDAVLVLAQALKDAHGNICGNKSGLCPSIANELYRHVLQYLPSVNVSYADFLPYFEDAAQNDKRLLFNSQGDVSCSVYNKIYDVQQFIGNTFTRIGQMNSLGLILDINKIRMMSDTMTELRYPNLPTSNCNKICPECFTVPDTPYLFESGDIIILGIFSIHQSNKLACGVHRDMNNGYLLAEGFLFAVKEASKYTGIKFGALVFDACASSVNSVKTLTRFFSGDLVINSDRSLPSKVVAVIGASISSITVVIAEILNQLRIPQISYGSTTTLLNDAARYPYFLRTVPSDDLQSHAMVEILIKKQLYNVKTINTNTIYGNTGIEYFIKHATAKDICVQKSFIIHSSSSNPEEYNNEITAIVNQINYAQVVIYFGHYNTLIKIWEKLKALRLKSAPLIIASESLGVNHEALAGVEDYAANTITFKIKSDYQVNKDNFLEYLDLKYPSVAMNVVKWVHNPWFIEFTQQYFNCNLPQSYRNKPGLPLCDKTISFARSNYNWTENWKLMHTIYATHAAAKGLNDALDRDLKGRCSKTNLCGGNYPTYSSTVMKRISEVYLDFYPKRAPFVFYPFSKASSKGYDIYSVQYDASRKIPASYTKIGVYSENRPIDLTETFLKKDLSTYGVECHPKMQCLNNVTCRKEESNENSQSVTDGTTNTLIIGFCATISVLVLILVVVIVFVFIRTRRRPDKRHPNPNRELPPLPHGGGIINGGYINGSLDSGQATSISSGRISGRMTFENSSEQDEDHYEDHYDHGDLPREARLRECNSPVCRCGNDIHVNNPDASTHHNHITSV